MPDNKKEFVLTELLMRLVENELNDNEIEKLNDWLSNDPEAAEFYWNFIKDYSAIKLHMDGQVDASETIDLSRNEFRRDIIESLSKNEISAPSISLQKNDEEDNSEKQNSKDLKSDRPNRFYRIYSAIVSIAAVLMVLFILYANLFPPNYTIEVATVVDQIDAVWNSNSEKLSLNHDIETNHPPYKLDSGIIKIAYDKGVDVVIEGPSKFQFEREGIYLSYGKVYSKVSKDAQGFTIDCQNSKFVDLGTEFGVIANEQGSSQLHVLDGKVQMYAGMEDTEKYTRAVFGGSAVGFDASDGTLENIILEDKAFARDINSSAKFVWRGQEFVNLADIVGGGNGFGTGKLESGIDPFTGEQVVNYHKYNYKGNLQEQIFSEVSWSKFVDSVFVPDGGKGAVKISSEGNEFDGCVDTMEDSWGCVQNGGIHYHPGNVKKHSLMLGGVKYDSKDSYALFMHANQGVTFNLDEIRKASVGLKIAGFRALCGVSETVNNDSLLSAAKLTERNEFEGRRECVFYVLVDGRLVYVNKGVSVGDEPGVIDIELADGDKYLTLIACTGQTVGYHWSMFAMPRLLVLYED